MTNNKITIPVIKKKIKMKPKTKKTKFKPKITEQDPSLWVNQDLDLGNFEQILHISDIHIRPLQRHDEFVSVFKTLDKELEHLCQTPSVLTVTGDVFDNKTIFKPETFKVCRDFFKLLAKHCPVLVIAGNHDMLENNLNRLDGITPIVDDIDNLHYLKYSGVYNSNDTEHSFVVSSLYDKQFISKADLETYCMTQEGRKYIALYHGTLTGAVSDTGFEAAEEEQGDKEETGSDKVSTRYRNISDFKDYDAVLLGDIHKHQIMKSSNPIAYAGSLIQQNHGENLAGHGILVWKNNEANELEPILHPIRNQYGFVDVMCENGEWSWTVEESDLPENCYARLIIKNCTATQVDLIVSEIKRKVKTLAISKKNCITEELNEFEIPPDIKRKEDEIDLIIEQANQKNYDADALVDLHKHYQSIIDAEDTSIVTAVWKPMVVEFKNMFGYGAGVVNRINFKRGVTAIMANNAVGKTSIVNILLFAIFGRTPLNPSTSTYTFDIINNKETTGYVKILLKYGDKYYLIERKTIRKKNSKITSAVLKMLNRYDFTCEVWESNIKGEKTLNCSETRKNNNDTFIRELFGDINDFSLSNLLNKESSLDLLSMTPTDQVKTLKRLFKMGIYDTYKDLNKQEVSAKEKEISSNKTKKLSMEGMIEEKVTPEELRDQEDETNGLEQECSQLKDEHELITEKIEQSRNQQQDIKDSIKEIQNELSGLGSDSDMEPDIDITKLQDDLEKYPESLKDTGDSVQYLKLKIETLQDKLDMVMSQLEGKEMPINVGVEALKTELKEAQEYVTELKLEFTSPTEATESQAYLNKILGQLTQTLENIDVTDDQPDLDLEHAQKQKLELTEQLVPLTSDLDELLSRKKELSNSKSNTNSNTETEMDYEETLSQLQSQLNSLTFDNTQLDKTRDRDLDLKLNLDLDELNAQLQPDKGYIVVDITMDDIQQLLQDVEDIQRKIDGLEESVITDIAQYVDVLSSCTLIDADLKEDYHLDKDKEYCIVEDTVVDKLMNHLENEDDRKKIMKHINTLSRQYSSKQQQAEQMQVKYDNNEIAKSNINIRAKINQLRWLENKSEISRLTEQRDHVLIMQELQKIAYHIETHQKNSEIKSTIEQLENVINWYQNREQMETLKEKIKTTEDKLALHDAKLDVIDIQQELDEHLNLITLAKQKETLTIDLQPLISQLELQADWEDMIVIQNKVEAYHMMQDIAEYEKDLQHLVNDHNILEKDGKTSRNRLRLLETDYQQAKEQLMVLKYQKSQSNKVERQIKEIDEELVRLEKEIIPLQDYNEIMGNKGITSKLLFNKIKAVEEYINSIISNFTRYTIIILYDEKKQSINIITKNNDSNNYLSVSRLSGYEKLMLQVSFKRALNKFSYNSKSSLVIIDEALDCIDQENFTTKLPDVMNLITQDYSTCLAISQRDIRHISDNIIQLSRDSNGVSYIT